jgi:hypothetical protein
MSLAMSLICLPCGDPTARLRCSIHGKHLDADFSGLARLLTGSVLACSLG